jgi:aspartate/glutamate racemase
MDIEVAGRAPPPGCLGIVGGMEPRARADLFGNIIATTPAQRDQDPMRAVSIVVAYTEHPFANL